MVNSKHAFWQAFIFAVIVFIFGIFIGFYLENHRGEEVRSNILQTEINTLDEQVRNELIKDSAIGCNTSIKSTFTFADKIYEDATRLELYDSSSKFTQDLKTVHKKYDLLRMMLWQEAQTLNAKCPNKFHTAIYLFIYSTDDINVKARQTVFSRVLVELKENHGSELLLIPIAVDLNLSSIDLIKESYNITSFPAIIVDERKVITQIPTYEQLEKDIFQSNKPLKP